MNKLISIAATICILAGINTPVLAQEKSGIQTAWMLTDGWFDQEELRFQRIENPNAFDGWAQTFIFGEDKNISYQLLMPDGRGICGNGLLYIESGSYKISKRNKRLRLRLTGGHMLYDQFEYDIKYKVIELTEEHLILRKRKTRKAEVNTACEPVGLS